MYGKNNENKSKKQQLNLIQHSEKLNVECMN